MRSPRTGRGSVPLDVATLRDLVADGRTWVKCARVADADHYEVIDEDGQKDIFVEVTLLPGGEPYACRLGKAVGGPGWGIWAIPPAGCEVVVLFPNGTAEGDGLIVCALDNEATHPDLAPERIVIAAPAGGQVYITDADGGAESLATKADVDALAAHVDTHTHFGVSAGSAATGPPSSASTPPAPVPPAPPEPPVAVPQTSPGAAGTSVLHAK